MFLSMDLSVCNKSLDVVLQSNVQIIFLSL